MSNQSQFVFEHGADLLRPPKVIAAFVARMTAGITSKRAVSEKRSEPRYTISAIVEAQPVDDEFRPTDSIFKAVTRDISACGIGMTHNRSIETKYLALQLTNPEGEQIQTVVEVLRCQSHGNTWDIGGRFVTKKSEMRQSLTHAAVVIGMWACELRVAPKIGNATSRRGLCLFHRVIGSGHSKFLCACLLESSLNQAASNRVTAKMNSIMNAQFLHDPISVTID